VPVPRSRTAPLLALLALAAPLAAEPVAPPELRLPAGARPVRMTVDLTVRPELETFDGRVSAEILLERPAARLWLNATGLEIGEARLLAGDETFAARVLPGGEDFVGFELEREAPAGAATLEIAYRGRLDPVETEGLFRQQDGGEWYAYSQFEATYARRAFPCFDEPSFRTPWRLTLHVRREHMAVSNTPVVAEREEEGGMKAVEFAETPPLPSYLIALGVGPFVAVDAGVWGRARTPVRIVVPRGREGRTGYAAEITGALLARLEDYFEIPHPFAKLDNLVIPQTVSFSAMENPGLITYAERVLLVDPANAAVGPRRAYASTAGHENAHLWFGDLVTMAWWDDIWLNEGFASWISDKVIAAWKPEWFAAAERAERRGSALGADSLSSARQVRRPIASKDDIVTAFDGIAYGKGASLLEMFEAWMGPERFRAGIRRYLRRHSWGNATSADFLAALGEEGGPEVARAFASFLDQPGAPMVSFALRCEEGGAARLELAQRRYLPLGTPAQASARWAIPIRMRIGSGARVEPVRALLDAERQALDLPFCPQWVAGNEEGIGYYLTAYQGDLLARAAEHADRLDAGEQIALLEDAARLFAAGELPPGAVLGLLPRFAGSPHRRVVETALEIAESIDDHLVSDAARPHYRRFLAAVFGARLEALGVDPRPGETGDEALLRPDLVALLAGPGEDAALAAAVRARVERWLSDRAALAPDLVPTYLKVAARHGDAALFDRLLDAAAREQDARARRSLLEALGAFRAPTLVDRALELFASGRFDRREAGWMLWTMIGERDSRQRLFDWTRGSFDELATRLPAQVTAALAYTAVGFCDAEHRREADQFFRPRTAGLPGGEIVLDQVLGIVDICIARRAAQEGTVSGFLTAY
jgi:alanyl aminopeptidase